MCEPENFDCDGVQVTIPWNKVHYEFNKIKPQSSPRLSDMNYELIKIYHTPVHQDPKHVSLLHVLDTEHFTGGHTTVTVESKSWRIPEVKKGHESAVLFVGELINFADQLCQLYPHYIPAYTGSVIASCNKDSNVKADIIKFNKLCTMHLNEAQCQLAQATKYLTQMTQMVNKLLNEDK